MAGHIVHVSSMAGHRVPGPDSGVYAATKFAVRALTEGLRQELRARQSPIRVSAVSPGIRRHGVRRGLLRAAADAQQTTRRTQGARAGRRRGDDPVGGEPAAARAGARRPAAPDGAEELTRRRAMDLRALLRDAAGVPRGRGIAAGVAAGVDRRAGDHRCGPASGPAQRRDRRGAQHHRLRAAGRRSRLRDTVGERGREDPRLLRGARRRPRRRPVRRRALGARPPDSLAARPRRRLIDGGHGFPTPFVDWCYTAPSRCASAVSS